MKDWHDRDVYDWVRVKDAIFQTQLELACWVASLRIEAELDCFQPLKNVPICDEEAVKHNLVVSIPLNHISIQETRSTPHSRAGCSLVPDRDNGVEPVWWQQRHAF